MKKFTLLTMLMVVAALALVACDAVIPGATPVEETTTGADSEAAEAPVDEASADVSGEAASEETAEQPAESAVDEPATEGGRIVTAWIGPELVDCVGVAPQQCMQVKTNPDDDYGLFYDQIDGFEFEEGYEYELQVLVEPVQNPAQDASALKFTLIEVVSKTPAAATGGEETTDESVEVTVEAGAEAAAPLALEGPTWLLNTYVDLQGQPTQSLPDTRVTITFADGQVSGSAGCNNYFGTYEMDGSSLTIGQVGSTMMACFPDEVVLQETAFLANLGNVAGYEIVDNQLHLLDADGQTILIFSEDVTPSLTGTIWTVNAYNNGNEAVVSVLDGTEMTAVFSEVGIVGGSAGCNSYRASFEADETIITIGPAAVTRKACADPEGIMEQEALYLAALETAASYEIQGPQMDLYDVDGARVATFTATAVVEEAAGESADLPVAAGDGSEEAAASDAAAGAEVGTEAAAAGIDLAGTRWQWMQMVTPVETFVPDDPAQYLMEFMADGVIGIQADCNSGSGSYETNSSEGSLSINITNTTLALCPEGSLSDQFIRSLNAAALYFDQDGNLFIDLFADGGTMEFAPN